MSTQFQVSLTWVLWQPEVPVKQPVLHWGECDEERQTMDIAIAIPHEPVEKAEMSVDQIQGGGPVSG
jgi:hypothetical protein